MMMTEQQKKLVEDNHNLIYGFLTKYGYDEDEYYDLAAIGLCKAAMKYDESKGSFGTLAYKWMKSSVGNEITNSQRQKRIPKSIIKSYEERLNYDNNDNMTVLDTIASDINIEDEVITKIDFARKIEKKIYRLTEGEKKILNLMIKGCNTNDITKILNVSKQWVNFCIPRIKEKLNLNEDKEIEKVQSKKKPYERKNSRKKQVDDFLAYMNS